MNKKIDWSKCKLKERQSLFGIDKADFEAWKRSTEKAKPLTLEAMMRAFDRLKKDAKEGE